MSKKKNRVTTILLIIIFISGIYLFLTGLNQYTNKKIESKVDSSIESVYSVRGDQNINLLSGWESQIIFSGSKDFQELGSGWYNNINNFPKIKIGTGNIENAELRLTFDFNNWYKKYYQSRIQGFTSDGKPARYIFAFRYFIGSFDNGGYVDVYRKRDNSVDNDVDEGLLGGYFGGEIFGGKEIIIPLKQVKIARDAGQYGYKILSPLDYLNNNKGKVLSIGGRISDREGTLLKKIEIRFIGDKDMITSY